MATINLPQVPFTLKGNTTEQKSCVDMVDALLREHLYNELCKYYAICDSNSRTSCLITKRRTSII